MSHTFAATVADAHTALVDTQDPAFRAHPSHAPDKESQWHYPVWRDGLVLANNAVRSEMVKMEAVLDHLGDRRLEEWEIIALKVRAAKRRLHNDDRPYYVSKD